MREACDVLLQDLDGLADAIRRRARRAPADADDPAARTVCTPSP
jgi:hypothetical protein